MTLLNTMLRVLLLCAASLPVANTGKAQYSTEVAVGNNFSQSLPEIPLNTADTSRPLLRDELKKLNASTGLFFLYSDETIGNTRVNAWTGANAGTERMLGFILDGTGLEYKKVNENTFAIVQKKNGNAASRHNELNGVTIKGRVVNADGSPVAGASVQVKGTKRGAVADQNGFFRIQARQREKVVVSSIGYHTGEFIIGDEAVFTLDFKVADDEMQEVTITALGISRDTRSMGYSISQLPGTQLSKVRENNVGNTLSGLVAGLNSSAPLTGPGGSSRVTIRGNSSLSFDNQPLYIVNGIPINNDNLGNAGKFGGADFGDGVTSINPDDIDELQVLKGGAAAALYGQRGRNGVILINTLSAGKGKKTDIVFNSNTVLDFVRDFTDFQETYGQGLQQSRPIDAASAIHAGLYSWGDRLDGQPTPVFDGSMKPYSAIEGSNLHRFYRTGLRTQQTLALGGYGDNTQWRVSLGDLRSQSVYPHSGFNRHTATADIRYQPGSRLSGHTYIQYSKETGRNRPNINDAPGNGNFAILFLPPNVDANWLKPGYDASGNEIVFNDNAFNTNPWFASAKFRNNTERDRLWGMTRLKYQFRPWMYLQGRVAHDYFSFGANSITPAGTAYKPDGTINLERSFQYNETNADLLLGIDKKLGPGISMHFSGGANLMIMRSRVLDVSADGLAFPFIYSQATASSSSVNSLTPRKNVHSVYASLLAVWNNSLFLTITDRQDWSSTLPSRDNSYNYPSASLAWSFAKYINWKILDRARLRLAWSRVGGDAPLFATKMYYGTNGNINGSPIGDMEDQVPNYNLQPLQVRETELGFETSFFDGRLKLDMAWYRRQTLNDIVAVSTSVTSGFQSALLNIGRIENRGLEILLGAEPIRKTNFLWSSTLNFAWNRNRVVHLSKGQNNMQLLNGESRTERAFVQHVVGLPFAQIMVFDVLRNENGKPILGTNGLQASPALTPAGTSIHPITGGWLNAIRWKRFELEWLVDYKMGGKIYSGTYATAVQRGFDPSTLKGREDGIFLEGVDNDNNPVTMHIPAQQYYESLYNISAWHVFDASFVKLRSLSLSYDLPQAWLPGSVDGISLSLVGRNLFYLFKNTPHIDPEANYSNGNAQGLEYASLPPTQSFGLHLRVNFK